MAQQLARKRTALGLYSLLLVLPTFVLGGLHWGQLQNEQQKQLDEVPANAEAGTRRLVEGVRRKLDALLASENTRRYNEYKREIYQEQPLDDDLTFIPSPLIPRNAPQGLQCWFAWDFRQAWGFGKNGEPGVVPRESLEYALFPGESEAWEDWSDVKGKLASTVEDLMLHDWDDGFPVRVTRYEEIAIQYSEPLSHAVVDLSRETDRECLRREKPALRQLRDVYVDIYQFDFHVRFYVEPDGTPRLLATRLILVDRTELLSAMPDCYSDLERGATLQQGFFIDPAWLFGEVPLKVAQQVLRDPETFSGLHAPHLTETDDLIVERIYLVDDLGLETYDPVDASYGELQVSIDLAKLKPRHQRQDRGFLAVAFMLLLSLGSGMLFLLRSVKRDLDQAHRTENFVAAVTHELRTPVAAIRLYGEMLRDGWAATPAKEEEYYGRIVQEAARLETMVERVLEKSQVASVESKPRAGDLNAFLRTLLQAQLKVGTDLSIDLAPDLPLVLMNPEAIRSITINLVENARKYAPADPNLGKAGKIYLRTRSAGEHVYLEVLDHGPGIPDEDKNQVFEAFFRRGDEATRRSQGTGLGLHLVKVQAQSIGGDVTIFDRPEGGCGFRVRLIPASGDEHPA